MSKFKKDILIISAAHIGAGLIAVLPDVLNAHQLENVVIVNSEDENQDHKSILSDELEFIITNPYFNEETPISILGEPYLFYYLDPTKNIIPILNMPILADNPHLKRRYIKGRQTFY